MKKKIRGKTQRIIDKIYKGALSSFEQLPKNQPAYSILKELINLFYIKVDTKINK